METTTQLSGTVIQNVKYASIILELAIDKTLDYSIPISMVESLKRGMQVEVSVRGVKRRGYVFAIKEGTTIFKVLPIEAIVSEHELISEELFELALWISKYYYTPLSFVIKSMLPGSIRKHIEPKEQLFVSRNKTRQELKNYIENIRNSYSKQADILDIMLLQSKGIFLSELIEKSKSSRSPVDTLVKKGLLKVETVRTGISPIACEEYFHTKPKPLNDEQIEALKKITHTLQAAIFETHLLFGVTGSGKTEVYMQAISHTLSLGKSALILVPEIALTAQTVERFKSRFPHDIAVLHHRLSDGERYHEWHKIKSGQAKIVIGARSAIFSPLHHLGLIIVDEEHENSYKQTDESPKYHARDVAVMRGYLQKACVILGSATPSLESFYNVEQKKYILSTLFQRAGSALMPKVTIVDMKKQLEKQGGFSLFSSQLIEGIKDRIEKGEQSILFLNRRGYFTLQLCKACGYTHKCSHCDVNLTFHFNDKILSCHLCGYSTKPPSECPSCRAIDTLKYRGIGTEQVERSIKALFPELRVTRIDADTTRHKGSHELLLREFRTGKADLLIGTQMISKGLHFPSVTLVGVLNSDSGLNIPDFRASENMFQLITQVSGRAGRGFAQGEVIIQSFIPDNQTLNLAKDQDFLAFYQEEIQVRRLFHYPPFTHMVKLTFTGSSAEGAFNMAKKWYDELVKLLVTPFELHPVVPSGHAKIKDKFRFQLIISGPSVYHMNNLISQVEVLISKSKDIHLSIDVDPLSTFF